MRGISAAQSIIVREATEMSELARQPGAQDNGCVLSTGRLILRDFNEDDFAAVHAYGSDPLVTQYTDWGPNTPDETRAFLGRAVARRHASPRIEFDFGIVLKTDAMLVGSCGLYVHKPEHREGMLGYVINRHYWGQGIATEAARAVVQFAFEQLGLHRVYATCDTENAASERVMRKLGMRREAHFREHLWQHERWRDSYVYAVLEGEWRTGMPG